VKSTVVKHPRTQLGRNLTIGEMQSLLVSIEVRLNAHDAVESADVLSKSAADSILYSARKLMRAILKTRGIV
jgi:hypothetical protein